MLPEVDHQQEDLSGSCSRFLDFPRFPSPVFGRFVAKECPMTVSEAGGFFFHLSDLGRNLINLFGILKIGELSWTTEFAIAFENSLASCEWASALARPV